MSLFRAVRSFVGRGREPTDGTQSPDSPLSSTSSNVKVIIDQEFRGQADKLKSYWALYSNMRNDSERESQFQKILPLFVSLYQDKDFRIATETFGERNLKQFTFVVAKKLVRDIRTAWKVNLPPESNSKSVLKMLSSEDKGGFNTLLALDIACSSTSNVDVATDAAIPSTIVKVIQLLFSLPPGADRHKEHCVDKLISFLCKIVPYRSVVLELLTTDTLTLLFNLISLQCPLHNISYKEKVLIVIKSITKLHIDRETVDYFHAKSSIRFQVINMRNNMDSFTPEFVIQAWATIVDWIQASSSISESLLKEFQSANGYQLLTETLHWVEKKDIGRSMIPEFLDVITLFVYVGTKDLDVPASISPYNNPQSLDLAPEQTKGTTVRNLPAFQVLQSYFLESSNFDCRMKVIDNIMSVYSANKLNFLLLQQLHTLAHFIEAFETLSFQLKDRILRVLELVVIVVNYVPFQELSSLSCLLQPNPSATTTVLIFQIITKLVNFDTKYKEILQEAGLLHMLITLLRQYHSQLTHLTDENILIFSKDDENHSIATYTVAMDCITLLIAGNAENVKIFRASGCTQVLLSFLFNRDTRTASLRVMQELIDADVEQGGGDIDSLIEILQASPDDTPEIKQDILHTFQRCFLSNGNTRDSFRKAHGFTCLVSLLLGLQMHSPDEKLNEEQIDTKTSIISTIFRTITAAVMTNEANRKYLRKNIVFVLAEVLLMTGILSSVKTFDVLDALLSIATENLTTLWEPEKLLINNPRVLMLIFELFPHTPMEVRVAILKRILQIIGLGRRNQEPLCHIGLLEFVLHNFEDTLQDSSHPLQPLLLSFIEELASHRISPLELRKFIGFLEAKDSSPALLTSLLRMAKQGYSPPFVEMDLQRFGYACLHLKSIGERSWPPANGYTFLCWLYIDSYDNISQRLDIFTFQSDDNRSVTTAHIQNGHFFLQTSAKSITEFPFNFQLKKWYHIGLVHTRSRFQPSEAKLYVNGQLHGSTKSTYITQASGNVGAYIGTPPDAQNYTDIVWRIGPCYLLEDTLNWDQVLLAYSLGPRYSSNFQGKFTSCTNYSIHNSRVLSIVQANDSSATLGILDPARVAINIAEERIVFALNASNVHAINTPSRLLSGSPVSAEQAAVIIHNSVETGSAYASLLGGSLAVASSGIFTGIYKIGGVDVVLLLVEKCSTPGALLDVIALLTILVQQNFRLTAQMEKIKGYSILATMLHNKQALLNKQTLDHIFELTGVIPTASDEEPVLVNTAAFRNLILYFQLWKWTPTDVQKQYFRRLNQLLVNNSQAAFNVHRMNRLHVLPKLLIILQDELLDPSLLDWIGNLIINLMAHQLTEEDLQSLTSFLITTLDDGTIKKPPARRRQRAVSCKRGSSSSDITKQSSSSPTNVPRNELPRKVIIRNMILEIIANLMVKLESYTLFLKVITPYWIFLFIDRDLHFSTVTLALKIFTLLVQSKSNFLQKFTASGGFHIMEEILPKFSECTSVYYLLSCLFIGKSPADLPVDISSLQLTYSDLVNTFKSPEMHVLCPQAMKVMMAMLRKCCAGHGSVPFSYINPLLSKDRYNAPKQLNLSTNHTGSSFSVRREPMEAMLTNVTNSLSQSQNAMEALGLKLKRWIISDRNLDIQKAIIKFVRYLFDNCTEFEEALWDGKKKELLRSIVSVLFPHETLNYPCDTSTDQFKKKEEEKCHISAKDLFDLLSHFLISANSYPNKTIVLLETLFECPPVSLSETEVLLYQSRLVFDFLRFTESSTSQQIFLENKTIASNLSKFCTFITDKVCAGLLPSVSGEFFDFLIEILERIEGIVPELPDYDERHPKTIPPMIPKGKMKAEIQIIYKSLNRVTIHLLNSSHGQTLKEYHSTMEHVMEAILIHHSIVLNLWNNDPEIIYVICQLLFKFLVDDNRRLQESSMSIWKLLLLTKTDIMNDILIYNPGKGIEPVDLRTDRFDLLLKRDFQTFDVFANWVGGALNMTNKVLGEQTSPVWMNYKENENKLRDEKLRQLKSKQTQLLAKREKKEKSIGSDIRSMYSWRSETISSIQEKTLRKYKRSKQEDIDRIKFMKTRWVKLRSQLTRQRGVWGSLDVDPLIKYKLDRTEGPFRMRKKEKGNHKFYAHYPFVRGLKEGQHSLKIPTSLDCPKHYEINGGYAVLYPSSSNPKKFPSPNKDRLSQDLSITPNTPKVFRISSDAVETESDSDQSTSGLFDDESSRGDISESEDLILDDPFLIEDDISEEEFSDDDDEREDKIHRLLESNDKIQVIYNCERVDGMVKRPGIFLICSSNIYIVDDYQYVDGEIIEANVLQNDDSLTTHHSRRWAFTEIRDVFKRRYLLRPVALEIFSMDGRNFLVVFEPKETLEVYHSLSAKISKNNRALEDISGNQIGTLLPGAEETRFGVMRFWKKDTLTQKWVQGQISNFQYLMHINMLAGRSYNDLTQYPVFPWVLADYESSTLNLDDPNIYRDLSKPMGALSPARASDFQLRYETWIPRENEGVPKWHYGSHYSSAGIVLYYLIRQEPFTQNFLNHLQSGRFDVADRLFHSIKETWMSSSGATLNMSDVKELIPEFYYLPEFLMNKNRFDLGKKQTGEVLDNVILPPWANDDPLEFIRLHRLALESEYVSAHLHEWIDLIFGYKQQGTSAEEALNVFYFLTYEGSVDIDAIDDPIEKDSVIAQINNFGQTPKQLFKKPHPQRQITSPSYPSILDVLGATRQERTTVRDIGKPVYYIQLVGDRLIVAGKNRICLPTRSYNKYLSWGFLDFSIRISYIDNEKVTNVIENSHDGQVSCLCASVDGSYIITGGKDSLIVVRKLRKTKGNRSFVFQKALCGNFSPICCIAVSRSYSTFVSVSEDNTVILWDLNRLVFVKTLELPSELSSKRITHVAINNITGNIVVVAGKWFLVCTINGIEIAVGESIETITALAMTEFNDWLSCEYITGHADGSVAVWTTNQRKLVLRAALNLQSSAVTCLHISSDGKRLFSGDAQGAVYQTIDGADTRLPFVS